MKLINPWDMVYRSEGHVFDKPYTGFADYIDKISNTKKYKNILDLGCGTGRHALPLARLGYNVYAFDISEYAVKLLRDGAIKDQLINGNLEACVSDMFEEFPYPDRFFDSIISIAVIYHGTINNIINTISEISRVLKPGGLIYFTASVSLEHSKRVNSGSNYIMVEKGTYLPLDGREKYLVHHYFTKDELYSILRSEYKNVTIDFDKDNYYQITAVRR